MSRRRNPNLKSAYSQETYTRDQFQEIMRCAADPAYFIKNYVYILHPVKGRIKFSLYDYQHDMVDLYHKSQRAIVLSARQTGKTETICAYLLWFAIFHEEVTILIASNKSRGAMEIISKIQNVYEYLPHWLKPGINDDSWNKHECNFDNKSRIVSTTTSKDSGRGMSISLLYCDEFAFVPNNIQNKFWTSISPTLSTGGRCIISSTPNGNSDLFAQLWRGAQNKTNDFAFMHVPWDAPPGRDDEFKKEQIGLLGKRKWLQEFECVFLSSEVTLIDSYILNQIESKMETKFADNDGVPPIAFSVGDLDFFKPINRDMTYLVGVDVASGNGNDYSVITVVEFPTMEQVLEFRSNKLSEQFLYARLKNILLYLQQNCEEVYFSVENNGLGASVLALYEFDDNPPRSAYLISEQNNKRLGLSMSEATKKRAALKFKNMIETETYNFYSLALLREMKSYTRQGATYKAEVGATDDSIAAHLIIMRIIEEMAEYNPHAYDKIYNTAGYDNMQDEWDSEFTNDPKTLDDMPMPITLG